MSKMPHVWAHTEYADMVYCLRFLRWKFPCWCRRISSTVSKRTEFRNEECFLKFSKRGVRVVHVPALMFHMNVNFNKMCELWKLPSFGRAHGQSLYPVHLLHVQHLQPGDGAMRLEFFRRGSDNCRLLRLILFIDEDTYSREGINNTRNPHWWSEKNPHAILLTNFRHFPVCQRMVHYHR